MIVFVLMMMMMMTIMIFSMDTSSSSSSLFTIVTIIKDCELHDQNFLDEKNRVETLTRNHHGDVRFYPLIFDPNDFEKKYGRSHDWAKIIAIKRVLSKTNHTVFYVDELKMLESIPISTIRRKEGRWFDSSQLEFLNHWWNLGEKYPNIDEAMHAAKNNLTGDDNADSMIMPYVKRPRNKEEIVVKEGLTLRVSLKHFSPFIRPHDDATRLCIRLDSKILLACVQYLSSTKKEISVTKESYVLHQAGACNECGMVICDSKYLVLNSEGVETETYPNTNITFHVGKSLNQWGCHHVHDSNFEVVRNRRTGVIYVVEKRLESSLQQHKSPSYCQRDDYLSSYENQDVNVNLIDPIRRYCEINKIPQLIAKHIYGINRDLEFWFEVRRHNQWNQIGASKRLRIDTVPISRDDEVFTHSKASLSSKKIKEEEEKEEEQEKEIVSEVVICVLMNRGLESFRRALRSWHESKLLNLVSGLYVYVQELHHDGNDVFKDKRLRHDDVMSILNVHNAIVIGQKDQIGIAQAFALLMKQVRLDNDETSSSSSPSILFLEEDFRIDPDVDLNSRLNEASKMLLHRNDDGADVVRLRSRKNAGAPDCYRVLFSHQINLLPVCARLSTAMWLSNEKIINRYPGIHICGDDDCCLCSRSIDAEWSNNPFLARLNWLEDYVVPVARADYEILGKIANLETPMREIPFLWSERDFRVVQTEGMFIHDDVDKPMEEQSWPCGLLHVQQQQQRELQHH